MVPFLFIVGAVGATIAVITMVRRAEKQRVAAMQAMAARLGWTYRGDVPFDTMGDLDRFELFTQGRRRTISNLVTSPAGDPRALLFDYTYTTGGGKSQSTHYQTVFYAASDGLRLPSFSVRPQRFFHTVAKMFGYQDIDIHQRPQFSEKFVLRGEDETAVRDAFGEALADFFESHEGACAAGTGHELLYWRAGRRLDRDDIESFVKEGLELAERFRGSTGSL